MSLFINDCQACVCCSAVEPQRLVSEWLLVLQLFCKHVTAAALAQPVGFTRVFCFLKTSLEKQWRWHVKEQTYLGCCLIRLGFSIQLCHFRGCRRLASSFCLWGLGADSHQERWAVMPAACLLLRQSKLHWCKTRWLKGSNRQIFFSSTHI